MDKLRMAGLGAAMAGCMALTACATAEEGAAELVGKTYRATLTGAQEVGGGDPDGTGLAEVTIANKMDQLCYDINQVHGIGTPTAAHIHKGRAGENGPPVITLKPAHEGGFKGCEKAPEWLQDAIPDNLSGYYVNIHTSDYPNGAIRGQLGK